MEKTNLLTLVVTLTVGIILAGSLLMPVITDATTTEKTFENTGLIQMEKLDADSEYSAYWDYTKPAKLTVNDVELDLPTDAAFAVNLYCNEEFFLRYYYSGTNGAASFLELYKYSTTAGSAVYTARVSESKNMSISISGGTITFNNGGSDYDLTFTSLFAISQNGDYVMKKATDATYLLGDSDILAHGRSNVVGATVDTLITGNITDGFTYDTWPDNIPISTDGTYTDDATQVGGYINLYTLKQISFEVTNTGTSATGTVTYSQFIVPKEVTAELAQHLDAGEIALINALPVIVIIGLVLAGVGAIFIRNRD